MNATNQKRMIHATSAFGSACAAIALVSNIGFWAGILPTADPILHPEKYEQVTHKLSFNPLKWSWREESGALGAGLVAGALGVIAAGSKRRRIREFNQSAETGGFGTGFDDQRESLINEIRETYQPGSKLSDEQLATLVMMTDDELGDLPTEARKEVMLTQRDIALYYRLEKSPQLITVSGPDEVPSYAALKGQRDEAFKAAGMKKEVGVQVYQFNKDKPAATDVKPGIGTRLKNTFTSNNNYYGHDDSFFWAYMWNSSMSNSNHYYGSGGHRSSGSSGSWDIDGDAAKGLVFVAAVAALAAVAAAQTTLTYKCAKRNWYKIPKVLDTSEDETVRLPAATEALGDMRKNPPKIMYSPTRGAHVA